MITISLLRRAGIINGDGSIEGYPNLTDKQCIAVIRGLKDACNQYCATAVDVSTVRNNINQYIAQHSNTGRTMPNSFPNYIILEILRTHGSKMTDYLLLDE